jgi:ubiquinone/menaquinone biosynthesis C-methylase UbiE
MKTISSAYGRELAHNYDEKRFSGSRGALLDQLEREQLHRVAQNLPGRSRTLEVGCGTGRFMGELLSAGYRVYGLDPSPYMLGQAKEKNTRSTNAEYLLGEGGSLPFPSETFDLVYSIRVITVVTSLEYSFRMIREMIRVCREEGAILVEFINKSRLTSLIPGIGNAERELSVKDIELFLEQYPSARLVDVAGTYFFSATVMSKVPRPFLHIYKKIDITLSKLFPRLCSRCYVTLEKAGSEG